MFLIWTHTHLCIAHRRERKRYMLGEGVHVSGIILYFLYILYRGSFSGFSSPWGFPRIILCVLLCGCAFLSFSDPFSHGYIVMMLNVIRSDIMIKNLTWYQIYPKIILCIAKTLLQLQLLKIRVSCLKTLED